LTSVLWYVNNYQVAFVDNELLYIIGLSLFVFNFFNFRTKAKCFAGDVGSISIAFILVFLLGLLIIKTEDFSYIVLLAVYGVDTVLTIIHRLMLKENIFDAHRKHVFQLMANELKIPQIIVSSTYMLSQSIIAVGLFFCFNHRWMYMLSVLLVLSAAYAIFMKRFFRLHQV